MFHRQVIANFGAVITDEAQKLVEQWRKTTRPVEVEDEMMNVTMQVIGRAMFSVDIKANAPGLHHAYNYIGPHIVQRLSNLFNFPLFVPTPANRQYKAELQTVLNVLGNIIEERKRTGELKHDLLDMLLAAQDEESQRQFSKGELMAEMSGIMFAGHETTATTLTWAMLLLSQNPAVLTKLQTEVDQVLTGRSAATIEDTNQLEYTKMVIQETLRLYPAAYLITRLAVADDEVEGYHIPAGKQVGINIYGVHHHPDYWPEPEQFRPERFSSEGLKQQHKMAYIPFLTGPRRCIGEQLALAEAQIVLATVVKNFNFQLVPGQDTKPVPKFALRTRNGLNMQVMVR
jgi:cytochrome P450